MVFPMITNIMMFFSRWVSLRIEVLAGLFSAILATWLVYGDGASAANAGFALTMAGTLHYT